MASNINNESNRDDNFTLLDTISFEGFEKLINRSDDGCVFLDHDYIKKFIIIDKKYFDEGTVFEGCYVLFNGISKVMSNASIKYKLVKLIANGEKFVDEIFIIFDKENRQLDYLIIHAQIILNEKPHLMSDIQYFSDSTKFEMLVNYFDYKTDNIMVHPDLLKVTISEKWKVNDFYKFEKMSN